MKEKKISDKKKTDPATIMFSNAWWGDMKKNWFKYLLKIIMYLLIFWLIWMAITPLISFQPWLSWWRSHGGSQYSKWCFSLYKLAYYEYFTLYYYIGEFLSGSDSSFTNPGQAEFIMMLLINYGIDIAPTGQMTPKALCDSIIPEVTSEWKPSEQSIKIINANISDWKTSDGWPQGSYTMWIDIVKDWGGSGGIQTPGNATTWQGAEDNFLYKWYGIEYNSLAIRAFVSGQATLDGNHLDRSIIKTMLGFVPATGWTAGGWWGMLRNLTGSDWDYGSYQRLFWESENAPSSTGACTTADKINAWTSGIGAVSSFAMFFPEGNLARLALTAVATGTGGLTVYSGYSSSGCT